MNPTPLLSRRQEILLELQELKQIRRGTITEQYVEATLKDGSQVRRGPYHLHTFKDKQQTVSRRLRHPSEVQTCRRQIEGFRRFQHLMEELLSIGEQLCEMKLEEASAVKKNRRFKWNRKGR